MSHLPAIMLAIVGATGLTEGILTVPGTPATAAAVTAPRPAAPDRTASPDTLTTALARIDSLLAVSDFATAEDSARDLLGAAEAWHGPASLPAAAVLERLVSALAGGGKTGDPQTRALAGRAVTIKADLLGPAHPELIPSLLEQGYLLRVAGDLAGAEQAFARVLAIGAATGDTTSAEQARAIGGLGKVSYRRGRYRAAADHFRHQMNLLAAHSGESARRQAATARMNRGAALRSGGRYEAAVAELRIALAELAAVLPPEHLLRGNAHNNLGLALQSAGQYHQAERHFDLAVRQKRAVLRGDHPQVAGSLINLGLAQERLGTLQAAAASFDRALAICRESLPPTHRYVASLHNNLGDLAQTRGDWATAQAHFETALAIHREVGGPDHPKVALTLMKLAGVAGEAGDQDQAETLLRESLALRRSTLPPEHPQIGQTLVALAQAARERGDLAAAAAACNEALRIYAVSLPADHPQVATAAVIGGQVARDRGDLAAAEASLRRALAIRTTALGPRHADVASVLIIRGDVAARRGDLTRAAALADSATAIATEQLGRDHPLVALALVHRGRWRAAQGQREAALADALEAEQIARDHLRLVARGLHQHRALIYAASRPRGLDLALGLLTGTDASRHAGEDDDVGARRDHHVFAGPAAVRAVLDAVIRSRAVVLDEMCRLQRAAPAEPALADLAQELARTREQLATLTLAGPGDRDLGAYRDLVRLVREERDRLERELARERRSRSETLAPAGGLPDVMAALDPQQALVSFVRHDDPRGSAGEAYTAFVSRAGAEPVLVPLAPAAAIERAVRSWRDAIRGGSVPDGPLSRRALATVDARGAELRALIWDPLLPALDGAHQVLLVPDGDLHLVNFGALPVAPGRYLVEDDRTLHLLAAERDLFPGRLAPPAERLVILAGASFGRTFGATSPQGGAVATRSLAHLPCAEVAELAFAPLPRTRYEAAMVRDLWWRGSGSGAAVDTLLGPSATAAALARAVPGATAVHLATHGFFLGDDCAGAGVSPLLLSGLAMNDGLLTAEEVASLDLRSARWVVLSACDTGIGEVSRSEGVLGLRRALQAAGAATVVMSLWPVDDRASETWMRELYAARFGAGQPVAEAVRDASRRVLSARREGGRSPHPLHWAGFVAVGDWR